MRLEDDVSGGDRLLVAGAAIEQLLVANSTAMAVRKWFTLFCFGSLVYVL